jgi:hypothetical protein
VCCQSPVSIKPQFILNAETISRLRPADYRVVQGPSYGFTIITSGFPFRGSEGEVFLPTAHLRRCYVPKNPLRCGSAGYRHCRSFHGLRDGDVALRRRSFAGPG